MGRNVGKTTTLVGDTVGAFELSTDCEILVENCTDGCDEGWDVGFVGCIDGCDDGCREGCREG